MEQFDQLIVGTGERIESENLVEFRLLFQGILLPSGGTNRRAAEKHEIRKHFHPQLRRLWTVKKGLSQLAMRKGVESKKGIARLKETGGLSPLPVLMDPEKRATHSEMFNLGLDAMGDNWNRSGFNFVPLVTSDIALRCRLDVLLLRPDEKKYIFEQGDIDGHLKTLFDALRIPKDAQEVGNARPEGDENPFFCLLENDNLISEVHVVADQLLVLPKEREVQANDAFAVIHVQLNHLGGSPFDRWFD